MPKRLFISETIPKSHRPTSVYFYEGDTERATRIVQNHNQYSGGTTPLYSQQDIYREALRQYLDRHDQREARKRARQGGANG